ncbi:golgin subfamily A member 6-like protein 7 [Chironomus tepperi]|uniref:golgin subfamily A member 6-like protein 7 n=1 Tax=Chironomus tepperi TaxID=113505 RepID=UPI00391F68E8
MFVFGPNWTHNIVHIDLYGFHLPFGHNHALRNSRYTEIQQLNDEEREIQEIRNIIASKQEKLSREQNEYRQQECEMRVKWEKLAYDREKIKREQEAMKRERDEIAYINHEKRQLLASERMRIAHERKLLAFEREQLAKEREEMIRKRKTLHNSSIQVFCSNDQPAQKRLKFVKLEEDSIVTETSVKATVMVNKVNNYTFNVNAPVKIRPTIPKRQAAIKANKKLAMNTEN